MIDKKIIEKIIENEFHHIQEHHETEELKDNKEYQEYQEDQAKTFMLFEQLDKGLYKDQRELLYEYDETISYWEVDLAKYYFKKGIEVAFTNLDFLKDYREVL